ncbi:Phytochrome-like protein [Lachnellula suecica]|uniref:Phytochrome-like protein n=1 Tax=Lachnellula suecica TaxID=602035 RepID=A0A8T9CFR2_9HELO|nr:Phytochrome-like protein [Lachnellula suecica]
MSDDENRGSRRQREAFSSPSDHTGERVFPIRARGDSDILGLFPKVDGQKTSGERAQQPNAPNLPNLSDLPSLPNFRANAGSVTSSRSGTSQGEEHRRVSERSHRKVLGYGPEQLFALSSILDVLKPEVRDDMVARVDHALSDLEAPKRETRLDVFQVILTFPYEPDISLWCAVHLAPNAEGLVICEFEDFANTFYLNNAGVMPSKPFSSTATDCSKEDFDKSTISGSKPLPVIDLARKKKKQSQEFSSLDIFNAINQAQNQITSCTTVQRVMDVTVGIISELTGFHRVMLYQFDSHKNGKSALNFIPDCSNDVQGVLKRSWSILKHLPISSEVFITPPLIFLPRLGNYTKPIVFASYTTVKQKRPDWYELLSSLVSRNEQDFDEPLDLTHAYLRAMSPIHHKYLANMGVRSSMSVSIVIDDDLWGLIACHEYGDIGLRVSLPIRELCRSVFRFPQDDFQTKLCDQSICLHVLLGDCAAVNIQRLLMKQRLEARKLPALKPTSNQNPTSFIAASSTDLLKLVDADFALVSIQDKIRAIGRMEPYHEALAIMTFLQSMRYSNIRTSQNIKADFPGITYPSGEKALSGLLLIPLNVGDENDFLVFFRKEILMLRKSNRAVSTLNQGRAFFDGQRQSLARAKNGPKISISNPNSGGSSMVVLLKLGDLKAKERTAPRPSRPKTARKDYQRRGFQLTIQNPDQLPGMVKGDRDGFHQLLVYFIDRAFGQSASAKVDVDLIHSKQGTSLIGLKIQDNGPGNSEEQLDDIFAEFEQAQEEDWPLPTNGTKVDLAFIARYVRTVNGQIMVTSELGKGTIFSIELPFEHSQTLEAPKPRKFRTLFSPTSNGSVRNGSTPASMKSPVSLRRNPNDFSKKVDVTESVASSPRSYDHALSHYGSNSGTPPPRSPLPDIDYGQHTPVHLNVLIADADYTSLRMLDERLSQFGHTVDIASDGQECHDRFASNPSKFDVILMDLNMPGVNGSPSTRLIRILERESKQDSQASKRVPIIATALSLDENSRFQYLKTG